MKAPIDPKVKELNGGKVWFPDSAFKTAQARQLRKEVVSPG